MENSKNEQMPKIKMLLQSWIEFGKSVQPGDECHVFCDDVSGEIIQWASEEDVTKDPLGYVKYLHPVHSFRYFGEGSGLLLEANPRGSVWTHLDDYRDRVMSGEVRIIIYRHPDITPEKLAKMKSEAERQAGHPYGWGALLGFGIRKLLWGTPIGAMWREYKWQTPWCSRNSPVCSQGVRMQKDNILEYYNVMKMLSKWQDNTPQRLFNESPALTIRALDSFDKIWHSAIN